RSARRLPRRSDAPIREHRDPPNIFLQLGGLQIHPSLAEDDCNLALIVQPIAAFGIDELAIGADDLASELPKSPEPGMADLLIGIALIRSATHLDGHRRSMIGEVSAGACYASIIRPWSV